jgi:hypothetical protein
MEAEMHKIRIALIAATVALLAGGAYAQGQAVPSSREAEVPTGMRKDDPCAEPKKQLKKKSTQRQGDEKAKADAKKQ